MRAIGAGMNQSAMLARFAREGDFDVFLLAGRYTLLDQSALADLLPICEENEIAIVVGGVMNSGVLADPRPGSRFNYAPAAADVVERAERLAAICARHGVPLRAAAVQFPLAHPAVVSVVAGVRRIDHLEEYPGSSAADPGRPLGRAPPRGPPRGRSREALTLLGSRFRGRRRRDMERSDNGRRAGGGPRRAPARAPR